MGEVWPTTDTKLNRDVALKVFRRSSLTTPTAWRDSSARERANILQSSCTTR